MSIGDISFHCRKYIFLSGQTDLHSDHKYMLLMIQKQDWKLQLMFEEIKRVKNNIKEYDYKFSAERN